jgi:hypothetical protein
MSYELKIKISSSENFYETKPITNVGGNTNLGTWNNEFSGEKRIFGEKQILRGETNFGGEKRILCVAWELGKMDFKGTTNFAVKN